MLWLWHRLVATALIGPLAWEPPYAMDVALEKTKRQKKKKKKGRKKERKKVIKVAVTIFIFYRTSLLKMSSGVRRSYKMRVLINVNFICFLKSYE